MEKSSVLGLLAVLALTPVFHAGAAGVSSLDETIKLSVSGELRIRAESYRDFMPDPDQDREFSFVGQRTRLAVRAEVADKFAAFIQLQDVRIWGEEADTLADYNADNFDVHQAYGEVYLPGNITIRSGRQEIVFDNHRLVGNVGWTFQARSFDGVRVIAKQGKFTLNGIYTVIEEPDSMNGSTLEADFYGGHLNWKPLPGLSCSALYLVQTDGDRDLERHTYGGMVNFKGGPLRAKAEYYSQAGEIGNGMGDILEIDAYLWSAGLGFQVGDEEGSYGLFAFRDQLSGDENPNKGRYRAFDTLYATNHAFYGFMDLFTNIPVHAFGRGLSDTAVRVHGSMDEFKLLADYHWFELAEEDGFGDKKLGTELDLTAKYKAGPGLDLMCGYSRFWPDEVFENRGRESQEEWAYFMAEFKF